MKILQPKIVKLAAMDWVEQLEMRNLLAHLRPIPISEILAM